MRLSDMQDMLGRVTDEELAVIKKDICTIIEKRSIEEEEKAVAEVISVIDKWAEHDIVFYMYDCNDHKLTLRPRDIYVERGWL